MGKTKGPYQPEFEMGATVRIASRAKLEGFRTTWKLHNKLEAAQLEYADETAFVESVSFYHGGDELYSLRGIPGIWHEQCLEATPEKAMPKE